MARSDPVLYEGILTLRAIAAAMPRFPHGVPEYGLGSHVFARTLGRKLHDRESERFHTRNLDQEPRER